MQQSLVWYYAVVRAFLQAQLVDRVVELYHYAIGAKPVVLPPLLSSLFICQ